VLKQHGIGDWLSKCQQSKLSKMAIYATLALYFILLFITFGISLNMLLAVLEATNFTSQKMAERNFGGAEAEWNACSKRTFIASGVIVGYIGLQNIIISITFFCLSHRHMGFKLGAFAVLIIPFLIGYLTQGF
jgi:hypothetical protein